MADEYKEGGNIKQQGIGLIRLLDLTKRHGHGLMEGVGMSQGTSSVRPKNLQ